jgi:hypothetical protein
MNPIVVTAYYNVHPLQQFSRTQHKAGNGSSACVPLQHSSGIPCHHFLTSSPKTQTPTNSELWIPQQQQLDSISFFSVGSILDLH